jgi:hypothetical protein
MRNILREIEVPEFLMLLLCGLVAAATEFWIRAPF